MVFAAGLMLASSSGNSDTTVGEAVAQINAFVKTASQQRLRAALDNGLMCYGIAAIASVFAIGIIHHLRH